MMLITTKKVEIQGLVPKVRAASHVSRRSFAHVRFIIDDDEVTDAELAQIGEMLSGPQRLQERRDASNTMVTAAIATAGERTQLHLRYWGRLTSLLRLAEARVTSNIPMGYINGNLTEHEGAYAIRRIAVAMLVLAVRDLFPPKWNLNEVNRRRFESIHKSQQERAVRWVFEADTLEARKWLYHFSVLCELLDISAEEFRFLVYQLGRRDPALQALFKFHAVQNRITIGKGGG